MGNVVISKNTTPTARAASREIFPLFSKGSRLRLLLGHRMSEGEKGRYGKSLIKKRWAPSRLTPSLPEPFQPSRPPAFPPPQQGRDACCTSRCSALLCFFAPDVLYVNISPLPSPPLSSPLLLLTRASSQRVFIFIHPVILLVGLGDGRF